MSDEKDLRPSPFVASVRPGGRFNPDIHIAFGNIFLEYVTSPIDDEIQSITGGCGMPDRADQGWIVVEGSKAQAAVSELVGMELDASVIGSGFCGMQVFNEKLPKCRADIYFDNERIFLGVARDVLSEVIVLLKAQQNQFEVTVEDKTDETVRIALMGPDSRKMLRALEVEDNQLCNLGDHIDVEIIFEPVKICRSDFAGPDGYDLIIPIKPFNNILAVLCSWGVRLELNLLPVGWQALQEVQKEK